MSVTEVILASLTVIGFVGTLPQLWGSDWRTIWLYYRRGLISWDAVHKGACRLIDRMRNAGFAPDVVVGVGRGGIICAGLVCSELTSERLAESTRSGESAIRSPRIRLESINSTVFLKNAATVMQAQTGRSPVSHVDRIELSDSCLSVAASDKVLLVVAQNYTGNSLQRATEMLLAKGIPRENIRTAAVFWLKDDRTDIVHEPDLYGVVAPIGKTMPWKASEINTDRY
jgi:hypoxanthine phosphoribosyltransferase